VGKLGRRSAQFQNQGTRSAQEEEGGIVTPEEKAYLEEVTQGANALAALFLAISMEIDLPVALRQENTQARIKEMCRRGGLGALALSGNAAARVMASEMQPEGYDLAGLALAPPATLED
jgi:hypothetical protein